MIPDLARIVAEYTVVPPTVIPIDLTKVDWRELSSNPAAVELLRENPDRINWSWLSMNRAAVELLRENLDRID